MSEGACYIIADDVLVQCSAREEVFQIPEGVRVIGEGAFKGCTSIQKIMMPDSVEEIKAHAFKGCRQLRSIRLSSRLKSIGDYAFHRCHNLQEISMPETVTALGQCTFLYCDQLRQVKMPGVKVLGRQNFLNDTELEVLCLSAKVDKEKICDCFTGCNKLKSIHLVEAMQEGKEKISEYEVENVIDVLSGKMSIHPVVDTIIHDIYRILEIKGETLTRYLENVKNIVLPEGIKAIGKSAFFDKRGIETVTFPKSLKYIDERAFRGCMNLKQVTFLSEEVELSDTAFFNCSALKAIYFPNGESVQLNGIYENDERCHVLAKQIQKQVLGNFVISDTMLLKYVGCESRVIVPNGITTIGQSAFAGNEGIDRIELPDSVRRIEREAFKGCVVMQSIRLSENLEELEDAVFENCVKLIRVNLSNKLKVMPTSCFKRCRVLKEVEGLEKVEVVEAMSFYECLQLETVALPEEITALGDMAFYKCTHLLESCLPLKVEKVGQLCFKKSSVQEVVNEKIVSGAYSLKAEKEVARSSYAMDYMEADKRKRALFEEKMASIDAAGTLIIAEGVTHIEGYTFFCDESIKKLILPESLSFIGEAAFYGCKQLKEIYFPKQEIVLGKSCFEKCIALENLTLYATQLADRCFAWCESLRKVEIDQTEMIGKAAFEGCHAIKKLNLPVTKKIKENSFQFCSGLVEVWFGETITLGDHSFAQCEQLNQIIVNKSVYFGAFSFADCGQLKVLFFQTAFLEDKEKCFMHSSAFRGCTGIDEVSYGEKQYVLNGYESLLNDNLPWWLDQIYGSACSAFEIDQKNEIRSYDGYGASIVIPMGITAIGREVFRDHEGLRNVSIAESVSSIGPRAFDKTEWLRRERKRSPFVIFKDILLDGATSKGSVTIPKAVKRVSGWAFANNMALTELIIDHPMQIEEFAFRNCIYLKRIILEDGKTYALTSLADLDREQPALVARIMRECYNCFKMEGDYLKECTGNIEKLQLPLGIRGIGKEVFKESNLLTHLILNEEVTTIEEGAFKQCKWLQKIENTQSITAIGQGAFLGCIRLEEIGEFKQLTSLGERAFENCCNLRKITLPEGLKVIPSRAFYRCQSLKKIILPRSIEKIAEDAFMYCPAERVQHV